MNLLAPPAILPRPNRVRVGTTALEAEALSCVAGHRVLLVEDDHAVRLVCGMLMADMGLVVEESTNGRDAWSRNIGHASYGLVLTDNHLPGLTGLELARRVQAAACMVPIVLMSSLLTPADVLLARQYGVRALLPKPFMAGELLEAISHALNCPSPKLPQVDLQRNPSRAILL